MAPKARMESLAKRREELAAEIEALKYRLEGLDEAMELLQVDGNNAASEGTRRKRESVKPVLIDLLQEVGGHGLNAVIAVGVASKRGLALDRNTVSSLLSRLKRDGIVEFDGHRYRLKGLIPEEPIRLRAVQG